MTKYQKYAEYKDSGVDALGRIPKEWSVMRGKFLFSEINERSENGDETLLSVSEYYGVKPRGENISEGEYLSRAESLEGYKKCYVNDLVMNIMLAWKRGLGISKYNGIVSPAYSVFRFNNKVSPDFMHYLLRTEEYIKYFKTRSTGIIDSRLRLYPDSFGDIFILLPSIDDQIQITNFLDHETAKIDSLIEKQQKLIELLKEKRQAVISHAVTKGLNPDVQMKDSGVEWLAEVPEHWAIPQIGYHAEVTKLTGFEYTNLWVPNDDGEIIALRGFNIQERYLDLNKTERISEKLSYKLIRSKLYKNDLVLPCTGTLGNAALIDKDNTYHINQNIAKVTYDKKLFFPEFCLYWMTSLPFRQMIDFNNTSGMQPVLLIGDIRKLPIVLPPLSEQVEVVSYLNIKTQKFDSLIKKAESAISLMQERRTALISAAVTGKIDVRNWQAPTLAGAQTELSA